MRHRAAPGAWSIGLVSCTVCCAACGSSWVRGMWCTKDQNSDQILFSSPDLVEMSSPTWSSVLSGVVLPAPLYFVASR